MYAWSIIINVIGLFLLGLEKIWKRRLAKYIPELCGDKNTNSSGKPRTKVFYQVIKFYE